MDISVQYLGKHFENPFVLASAPPTANGAMIARAFEAGWAGAVIKTLIREPVKNLKNRFGSVRYADAVIGFENIELLSEMAPEEWYKDIRHLKKNYPKKIIIGSIMGDAKDKEQWLDLALGCQEAGVDFIELNFSCPHGYPEKGKGMAIGQNSEYSAMITSWVKSDKRVTIPVVPKLTAAVSDISYIGEAVRNAGADGISAINTFPSIIGVDLKTLMPKPSVNGCTTAGGYSGPGLKPIALRCISDLRKSPGLPIMAAGGVSSGYDAAEFILMGAPVIQVCTAVMLNGYGIIERLENELKGLMSMHKFASINDFLGVVYGRVHAFSELEPKFSVKAKIDTGKCTRCGACYISCRDAAYQAIEIKDGVTIVNPEKCDGCSLCYQVCPSNAISMVECK